LNCGDVPPADLAVNVIDRPAACGLGTLELIDVTVSVVGLEPPVPPPLPVVWKLRTALLRSMFAIVRLTTFQ
jgi:hypothetical protein